MEAWKSINYTSLSPVYALALTTERWGLERFPPNLVAITGYRENIGHLNNTVQTAWTVPYSCSSDSPSDYDEYRYNSHYYTYPYSDREHTNVSASTNICTEPQSCPSSGCIILIEGIGKTTTGPANSNIVGLSHAISLLIAIIVTTTIIMGCLSSRPTTPERQPTPSRKTSSRKRVPDRQPAPGEQAVPDRQMGHNPPMSRTVRPEDLLPYMNPPEQLGETQTAQAATPANMAKEVARCSGLLRQMYTLDIQIWSMEGCIESEIPQREEMERKANAVFVEVRRIIHDWRSNPNSKWKPEELQQIEAICNIVDQHDARRYQ
ncbi:MAG: hypothetical protein M1839_007612 [Geoglossum umbratile]|nr:MAG: hypothetical protein M1839_007612 [Geoglossum umbratile]